MRPQIRFTVAEVNTLLIFLAYTLGHLNDVLDEDEISDLFQSAELLRERILRYVLHPVPVGGVVPDFLGSSSRRGGRQVGELGSSTY
jgi:hypothetical protein